MKCLFARLYGFVVSRLRARDHFAAITSAAANTLSVCPFTERFGPAGATLFRPYLPRYSVWQHYGVVLFSKKWSPGASVQHRALIFSRT